MKTDQTENEFSEEETTKPASIDAAVRQRLRDGVPGTLPDEITQPIKIGTSLGQPPALPAAKQDGLGLSGFDDEEKTLVPTGDE